MVDHGELELNCLDQELYDLATPASNGEGDSGVDDMNIDPSLLEDLHTEHQLQPKSLASVVTDALEKFSEVEDSEILNVDVADEIPAIRVDPDTVPDITQSKLLKIPDLCAQCYSYYDAYSHPKATMESHLERAKHLAHALLRHYFPSSQGFIVEPTSLLPTSKYGWSMETLPAEQIGHQKGKTPKRKSNPEPSVDPTYHLIPADLITGFVVKKRYIETDPEDNSETEIAIPHTYLAIMIDTLATKPTWQTNPCQRGDIMSYHLGHLSQIEKGTAILIVGNMVEFYRFNLKNEKHQYMSRLVQKDWSLPMDESHLALVNQGFMHVVQAHVVYQDGFVGEGATRWNTGELKVLDE
ncbi:hypothetical protein BCR34DRAFT_598408 [Clohesyomyces aquaticus]|uniref:Uncharacterized protein n=1 Tax=Clohesyomyces aquaticus TaxID=1231657 RepID=A0A1Y1ZYY7_9PLEO|nr:hypothetical protein BCR34DRAFT_598408 [Clohesyomyces aquaticus]